VCAAGGGTVPTKQAPQMCKQTNKQAVMRSARKAMIPDAVGVGVGVCGSVITS
jgi:hypothetical protein